VTAGGAFEIVSGGGGLVYDTIPDNTSGGSVQGTITVRVRNGARPGDKGTLSASGEYMVLDDEYNGSMSLFYGSYIASVISGPVSSAASELETVPEPALDLTSAVEMEASEAPAVFPSPVIRPDTTGMPDASTAPARDASTTPAPAASPSPRETADQRKYLPLAGPDNMGAAFSAEPERAGKNQLSSAVVIAAGLVVALAGALAIMRLLRVGLFNRRAEHAGADGSLFMETDAVLTRADYKRMMKKRRH
jgi:hypothetical protein